MTDRVEIVERRWLMNKAQKRTWWTFAISAVTLLISGAVLWYVWVNEIILIDIERPMLIRLLGMVNAIPLILILIISYRIQKKDYDERDKVICRKSDGFGYIAAMIFLVAGGFFLFCIVEPLEATTNIYIWMRFTYLVYLACFAGWLVSAIAALAQYGWRSKHE